MFYLESKNFQLELEVVSVDSLLQHEETISGPMRKLILALKNQAHLHNPIIIDENHVVLDGNHRAFAFKELKFKHIAACRINYFHKKTKLRYWYRHLRTSPRLNRIKRAVAELKGDWRDVEDKDSLQKALEKDRLCCGIQRGDFFASVRFRDDVVNDAVSAYGIFNQIQEKLVGEGSTLEYIPCNAVHEADFCAGLNADEVVLWSPRITKEMVVDAARRQKIFTPKATRHLIPARPLNVDVPTEWFTEDISLEEINRRFADHLRGKKIQHLGPGQIVHGRYYEEELFVFYDKKSIRQG
jgi:L-serine kinase (ADP)